MVDGLNFKYLILKITKWLVPTFTEHSLLRTPGKEGMVTPVSKVAFYDFLELCMLKEKDNPATITEKLTTPFSIN